MSDCNTILDGNFPHMTSVPSAQSNAPHLNNQKQIVAEFPALSMLQGEPMNNLYTGFNMSNHVGLLDCNASVPRNAPLGRNTITDPSCPINNVQVQELFLGGMPISAASLAAALAARGGPHDNLNELGTSSPSAYPLDILKASVSNYYDDDALNSAFTTSMNCEYDGILGAMNGKLDFDKFLTCPDLAGKVPRRTGFQSFQLMGNINPDGWISSDNANMRSNNPFGSKFSNELSLGLATCQPSIIHGTSIPDRCSEISCSGVAHHSLNGRQLGSETSCNSKNLSLSFRSCRPVKFPQFLSGSRYLPVIQEILAEIASYSLENLVKMNYSASRIGAGAKFLFSSSRHANRGYAVVGSDDFPDGDARFEVQMDPVLQGRADEAKKKRLLTLLQVVDDQYNQCLDEIHTVISAFHAATELDPQIHARFALQTISSLYKNLRERISNQILAMGSYCNKGDTREQDRSFETSFIQKQWALQQLRRKDHQLWRPQRGLPERSVSILRAWMFQNFLHPYPKDAEKHLLAVKSGLTRSQVSNWFINARVRLWKPMIEEMYTDMNRRKGRRNNEETDNNHKSHKSIENQRVKMN